MTTRREIITNGIGLAGIIAAGRAPAAIVRSMVAARGAAMGGGSEEPKDGIYLYLQGVSAGDNVWLMLYGDNGSDFYIDWGDGNVVKGLTQKYYLQTHTYADDGDFVIILTGKIQIWTESNNNRYPFIAKGWNVAYNKLKKIEVYGNSYFTNVGSWTFQGLHNMSEVNLYATKKLEGLNFHNTSVKKITGIENVTEIGWWAFYGCRGVSSIKLGTITKFTSQDIFTNLGSGLPAIEGVKSNVEVGNTIDSWRGNISGYSFPYGASTAVKFVCSDGYIKYENGAWVNHYIN